MLPNKVPLQVGQQCPTWDSGSARLMGRIRKTLPQNYVGFSIVRLITWLDWPVRDCLNSTTIHKLGLHVLCSIGVTELLLLMEFAERFGKLYRCDEANSDTRLQASD